MNRGLLSERMGGLVVLKRRKKRGRNLSRIEEKKRKENEHHELTLNVLSDWSKPIEIKLKLIIMFSLVKQSGLWTSWQGLL